MANLDTLCRPCRVIEEALKSGDVALRKRLRKDCTVCESGLYRLMPSVIAATGRRTAGIILDRHESPWILTPAPSVEPLAVLASRGPTERRLLAEARAWRVNPSDPATPNQLAKLIVDIATGEAENVKPVAPRSNRDTTDEYTSLTV
jgi:hypothetical protein